MQDSDIPAKFNHPWAYSAGGAYIRPIPEASQIGIQNGAASITDGFPPNCFIPIAGGGSWPWGQDANGILNQITAWDRWNSAGGPVVYDATFQTAIGGYPRGAVVRASVGSNVFWQSFTDNNVTNPNAGGAGWQAPVFETPAGGQSLTLTGATGRGANLLLIGNGATTPSKTMRVIGGNFQIVNDGYSVPIVNLDDAGNLILSGGLTGATFVATTSGNITANGGRLRASLQSGGDPAAATLLSEFQFGINGFGAYMIFPGGLIIQSGLVISVAGAFGSGNYNFPTGFPHQCFMIVGTDDGAGLGDIGIQPGGGYGVPTGFFTAAAGYNNGFGNTPTLAGGIGINWYAMGY